MLYLGLFPGPEEVKLHKINHFLSPIVDELLEFWDGIDLPSGSFPNSKRAIELELMRIITQNSRLNCLISIQSDNPKLMEALSLVQNRPTTGSLAAYDRFDFAELYRFMRTFHQNIDITITGCEEFPGKMITPKKDFVSIAEFVSNNLTSSNSENQPIVVSPNVSQFGHIQIATEIFGSALAPRYQRSSYVTSKFIQDDESVDIFPRQVQFYFEHTVPFPTDPGSEFSGINDPAIKALGWKADKPSNFIIKGNSKHITNSLLGWYTDVPVTLKDKEDKTVTVIGNFVRIDNGETEPMLFFDMSNIRKVQGIPEPNKNQFRIKLHGKAYIIYPNL
ncbi:hypothetical protein RhiirC2_823227 [Rhizophagus irregularis]|uniref:Uncharacterized protein n=1 Tax=Rhizophagus irregularis TaxID=588596 RepID=A0A2N1M9R4_9GLOM|nr:hypothetical protein RhiirC2_823227 [Rhizophagus irregularis]